MDCEVSNISDEWLSCVDQILTKSRKQAEKPQLHTVTANKKNNTHSLTNLKFCYINSRNPATDQRELPNQVTTFYATPDRSAAHRHLPVSPHSKATTLLSIIPHAPLILGSLPTTALQRISMQLFILFTRLSLYIILHPDRFTSLPLRPSQDYIFANFLWLLICRRIHHSPEAQDMPWHLPHLDVHRAFDGFTHTASPILIKAVPTSSLNADEEQGIMTDVRIRRQHKKI